MDGVAIECGIKLPLWFCFCFFHLVSTEDRCRTLDFREYYPDRAFNKSIIQNLTVDSEDNCQVACFIQPACKSYNLGPPDGQGKRVCELSSSRHFSHSNHLVSRPSFIYRPSVDWCQSPCPDNKTCFPDDAAGYSCLCTDPGFQGERCDEDIDECSTDAHGCSENAQCTNNVGSFTCSCKGGFEGKGKTCQDINECSTGAHDCVADAQCTNSVGSFNCTCKDGFDGNGKECQDINECETGSNNCHVNATCTNTEGSYKCTCNDDVIGDGVLCLGFLFHWTLNGSDPLVSLYNGSSYNTTDGRTVLYLDGDQRSYAQTPDIPIQKISFSLLCWVKVLSLSGHSVHIYSDWSTPFQFGLYINNPLAQLCADLRRGGPYSQNKSIVAFCAGHITIGEWMHVAATWSRENRVGKLYINGTETGEQQALGPPDRIELNPTGHKVYDIGLKRDSGDTLHGYLRDLMVIDRAISEEELKSIFDGSK